MRTGPGPCEHERVPRRVEEKAVTTATQLSVRVPADMRVPVRATPREPEPVQEPARMYRRRDQRVLAGVAGGLADHLGVNVVWVRATLAALCVLGGAGVMAYAMFWVFVPQRAEDDTGAYVPPRERRQAVGLMALGVGLAVASSALSGVFSGWVAAALAIALIGAVVVWREADESQRESARSGTRTGFAGALLGGGGWTAVVRIVAGVALVATGIMVVVLRSGSLDQVQFALLAVVAALIGVAVLTVPFWLRMVRDLSEERRARIRTEERAEIAAHLHDSVLQTLALIQKQAESPREVARLARSQERQLRGWLYGASGYGASEPGADRDVRMLSELIAQACGEVEDTFAISVQQVVVGDAEVGEELLALVQAAREAMVNAAKHSGVREVSVYVEVEPSVVSVFVRDRGAGFDPAAVPPDRRGLTDSIRGRMERNGGTWELRTAPGEGTEVRLRMPVRAKKEAAQ